MPEPGGQRTVKLGTHNYVVVPQRQARLQRRIPAIFTDLGDTDAANLLAVATAKSYDLLGVFIPDLMPRWEYDGFASQEAADADNYDENADRSPTHVEVQNALGACLEVNGIDKLKLLGNVVSPEMVRALVTAQIADAASTRSRNSRALNGAPALTTSGTTQPTSEDRGEPASVDGPSPD